MTEGGWATGQGRSWPPWESSTPTGAWVQNALTSPSGGATVHPEMRFILIFGRPTTGRVALAAVACLGLAGCRAGPSTNDARPTVVASFYPPYEAAVQVGGRLVEAENLTPAGAEPHDLELSPTQVDLVLDADVLLYAGGGFQPAVEQLATRREGITVDILEAAEPGATGDPHVWLDPLRMERIVGTTAEGLSRADPAEAGTYRRNARRYSDDIHQLHLRFEEELADCKERTFVTSHRAFSYLAARYGLREESLSGPSPEAEPDPARLEELRPVVERTGVVFAEPLLPPAAVETLARETGARVEFLDPLEGLTEEDLARGATYVSVMERNLSVLREALDCR